MAVNEKKKDEREIESAEVRQPVPAGMWDAAPCAGLPCLAARRALSAQRQP